MVVSDPAFEDIARRFATRTADDRAQLDALRASFEKSDPRALHEVHQIMHRLAGAAGTFGWEGLSRSARSLTEALRAGESDTCERQQMLRAVLSEIDAMTRKSKR